MTGIQDLLVIVLWLSIAVVCLDLAFVLFVLVRRAVRHRYFLRKDAARARFVPALKVILSTKIAPNIAIERLGPIRGRAERDALSGSLVAAITVENCTRATDLLVHLGFVEEWAEEAFGRNRALALIRHVHTDEPLDERSSWRWRLAALYNLRCFAVARAAAVQKLGRLAPEYADAFIEEAKHDPSPEVRHVNINNMGRSSSALEYLLPELASAIEERNGIAVRTIKAAIVRAEISNPDVLVGFLQHHSERVRFLVVDSIREVCSKPREVPLSAADFPPAMYRVFLQTLAKDACTDVRARSAAVIRHFRDPAASSVLCRLMRDENEFVRLHAVRACADGYYSALVPEICERLSDQRWRVREAAVKTLMHLGTRGIRALADAFLTTKDRYATEQIADELQRTGALLDVINSLDSGYEPSRIATEVCRKMIAMGKSSFLAEMLGKHQSVAKRERLMDLLSTTHAPYTTAVLDWIASHPTDPLAIAARSREPGGRIAFAAEAGGGK